MVRPNNSNDKDAGSVFPAKPDDVAGIGELAIIFYIIPCVFVCLTVYELVCLTRSTPLRRQNLSSRITQQQISLSFTLTLTYNN